MIAKQPCVYILASRKDGILYTGVTSDIVQRVYQHKHKITQEFSKKYNVNLLVYYEQHETMEMAITAEKKIKKWNRQWKIDLLEKDNPEWRDLYDDIVR